MNPSMHRTKLFAVAAALVVAGAAAIAFSGGASAASWHVYEGDMFAGHAYGLQVPDGAESIEFSFQGAQTGAVSLGVYAPSGERVGHYALSPSLDTASIANPSAGQYAVYVYDVTDGALGVRVASEDEPALDMTSLSLTREELTVGTFEEGKLDRIITAELPAEPVFVTLLYDGSSRGLDATVATEKGVVVTITKESATAFSPGVWTTLKGERAFDASNLDGTLYTIEAHAESFEGTMVLTTLALDLPRAPTPVGVVPPAPPAGPAPPAVPAHEPVFHESAAVFSLGVGDAVAFEAPAGVLQLVDPAMLECEAEQQEAGEANGEECYYYSHAMLTIYAPDDTVLAVVTLSHEQTVAEVELPVRGEYVAYTHSADRDHVLAKIVGASAAPEVRVLEIAEEEFTSDGSSFFGGEPVDITLAHVPLMVELSWDGLGALANAYLENENGMVAATDGMLVIGGSPMWFGTYQVPENFASGPHTLSVNGLYEGSLTIVSYHYLRDSEIEPTEPTNEEAQEDPEEPEEEEPSGFPFPAPPMIPEIQLPL